MIQAVLATSARVPAADEREALRRAGMPRGFG